ncbi:MAG: hypothetical protein IJQ47_11335 [Synergistaceae bacterium]|nr:hypothetical protein [Synergistaceae bacterium]
MAQENTGETEIKFPRPGKVLREYNMDYFIDRLAKLKIRLNEFRVLKKEKDFSSNDVRRSHEQFFDDGDKFLQVLEEIVLDIKVAMKYYKNIKEQAQALQKISREFDKRNKEFLDEMLEKGIDPLAPLDFAREIEAAVDLKRRELERRKQKLDKAEEEIAITTEVLAKKKSEMEKALQHRYTLTEQQKITLLVEKDMILDGIEQWGTVTGAVKNNNKITTKASTIQMYAQLFPEFGQAIQVSKALFKDKLDSLMVERAIEGTENPVFGKGEHIGDFKIKDNKLFMELMKAKVPEEYNRKASESKKAAKIENLNIISFANIDETKEGFTKDVGVVIDVDETGRVERITQEKPLTERETQEQKMVEFYKKKEGAQIIEPEQEGE